MNPKEAFEAIGGIAKGIEIIYPRFDTYHIALELIKKYHLKSDQVFDGYLAATALSNGIDTIATDNVKDFKKFKEIKVKNPFD